MVISRTSENTFYFASQCVGNHVDVSPQVLDYTTSSLPDSDGMSSWATRRSS